jgi:hypothetical protein
MSRLSAPLPETVIAVDLMQRLSDRMSTRMEKVQISYDHISCHGLDGSRGVARNTGGSPVRFLRIQGKLDKYCPVFAMGPLPSQTL